MIDLNAYSVMLRLMEDAMVKDLIVWREHLQEQTAIPPESMLFVVPRGSLQGIPVAVLYGTPVIWADVERPMVALPVPRMPG
jgi:hypothetical protein